MTTAVTPFSQPFTFVTVADSFPCSDPFSAPYSRAKTFSFQPELTSYAVSG